MPYWVNLVKNHPALYGYLTVKEPSWNGLSPTEIRSIYSAYHKADPTHPVVAIFGDIPHFDMVGNRWSAGMADILMVDWYPVETSNGGCSRTGTHYITTGPKHFTKVRSIVAAKTPGTPDLADGPDPQEPEPELPQEAGTDRAAPAPQVREALRYLGATGIAFHTWSEHELPADQRRSAATVRWMRTIANQVHAGTFQ